MFMRSCFQLEFGEYKVPETDIPKGSALAAIIVSSNQLQYEAHKNLFRARRVRVVISF